MGFSFSGCLKQSKKGLCQANDVPHPYAFIVKQNKKHPITFPTSKSVPTQFSVTPV